LVSNPPKLSPNVGEASPLRGPFIPACRDVHILAPGSRLPATSKNKTNLPGGHRVGVRFHRTKTDKLQNEPNFPRFQPKNKDHQKNEPNSRPKQTQIFLHNLCNRCNLWFQITKTNPIRSF
jgi:hypothetical protein